MVNIPTIGQKYLVTVDNWFYAPDGESYRAVWGTVHGIANDKDTLGVATNRHSSNWYLLIGDMIVAGCQIHYAIKCDSYKDSAPLRYPEKDKDRTRRDPVCPIYNAD